MQTGASNPGPYGRLARFVLSYRRAVAVLLTTLFVVSAALGLPPDVSSNILELLPESDPSARALRKLDAEGGVTVYTLKFTHPDPETLDAYLDLFCAELEFDPLVDHAIHEIDPDLAAQIGLLQLSSKEVRELNHRLKGALALGPALNPIVTQRLMDMGPLAKKIGQADGFDMFEQDGRVIVRPAGSSADQEFVVKLVELVEKVGLDVRASDARFADVELIFEGGAYRTNYDTMQGIRTDIAATSGLSMALVMGVVVLSFRSLRATVLVAAPLLLANVVNLALVWAFVGTLNTYTSFGTAILIGLGIDFAVHLVGRYREERASGKPVEDAIIVAWDRTGPPCTTAAFTSAAGFLALAVADFQGFSQLGLLLATGLLVCLLAMLVTLPLLIAVLDPDPPGMLGVVQAPPGQSRATYRLAPVGLMVAVLATCWIGADRLPELRWEFDISQLRRDGAAYDELSPEERELARDSFAPEVVFYATESALRRDQYRLLRMIDDGRLDYVKTVVSIESVLPVDQGERLSALRELKKSLQHRNLRYLPRPIVEQLLPLRDRDLTPMGRSDLPPAVLVLLGAEKEHENRMLVVPKGNMWDLRETSKLASEVRKALPGRTIAGEHMSMGALYDTIMRDMPIVGALALVMVTLLCSIDLRKAHYTVGAIGTLLAGMIWAGSMVEIVGVKLSVLNIVGLPILLGIGVDVVIHLLHRLREEGPGGVRRALRTTGVAATISTVTTILSFCSLLIAGNRGIRSLGLLVVVGLATVFVASALLLPLAWAAGWKVTGRAPADTVPPPPRRSAAP